MSTASIHPIYSYLGFKEWNTELKKTKQKQKMRRISSHQKTKKRRPPVGVCPCSRGWMLHMLNIAVTRAPIMIYIILTIFKECQKVFGI